METRFSGHLRDLKKLTPPGIGRGAGICLGCGRDGNMAVHRLGSAIAPLFAFGLSRWCR
ncbi:hypothetical protein DESC_100011 [Desulfosarcina cetonica]|nr:hypothetical protein DESC_100011 [Desulfosarcina cetonica]